MVLARTHQRIIGEKAATPEAANNLLKVLRVILVYAVSLDMIAANPAAGGEKIPEPGEGFHRWREEEIAQFRGAARDGLASRGWRFAAIAYTAQRRCDVVRMGWQHVNGD